MPDLEIHVLAECYASPTHYYAAVLIGRSTRYTHASVRPSVRSLSHARR